MTAIALPAADDVMALLRGVIDPELGSDIVELGMAKGARVQPDGDVVVTIALTTAGCPLRAQIQRDVRARVGSLPGVTHVTLDWTEMTQESLHPSICIYDFKKNQLTLAIIIGICN
jgi:ATP-binding protein involved in chromosome partitioning